MSYIEHNATVGKIIFTDNMLAKMKSHGLDQGYIIDTLKYGNDQSPRIPGTQQRMYVFHQNKEVGVIYSTKDQDGKPTDSIILISCWTRKLLY